MIFDNIHIASPKLTTLTVKEGRSVTAYRFLNPRSAGEAYQRIMKKSQEYKNARKK